MYFRHEKTRQGQKQLIEDMKKVVDKGIVGLFEAPTGLGKTDASLAATLKYALENKKKIFFATPKNSQHKIVIDAIKEINKKHNTKIRAIDLVAKPYLCIDPFLYNTFDGFYELCDKKVKKHSCQGYLNAVGYNKEQKTKAFRNIENIKSKYFTLTNDEMREVCLEQDMCPYEASLALLQEADVIVADINYAFLPTLRQKILLKTKTNLEDFIFIFDEAHNLLNRLRNALSLSISDKTIKNALNETTKTNIESKADLFAFLEEFQKIMYKQKSGFMGVDLFKHLFLDYDYDAIIDALTQASEFIIDKYNKKSALKNILDFIERWFLNQDNTTRYVSENNKEKRFHIKLLDPSILADEVLNKSYASLLMSATLSPMNMFIDLLGIKKEYISKQYISPFAKENKLIMYSSDVTTKYEERKESMPKIKNIIQELIENISGNVAIFFPSFTLANEIYLKIVHNTTKKLFIQKPNMPVNVGKRIIDEFKSHKNKGGAVLFAVMGGSFSEGIDLPGENLIGLAIVGLPFPEPDYEIKALIEYYDKKYNAGWDYGYLYPTFAKITQTAGRVIRTEQDKGFILLLDKRYTWKKYKQLLPNDYDLKPYDLKIIKEFFANK